jgi:zinc protease
MTTPSAGAVTDVVVPTRPTPGMPRPYDFPEFDRHHLTNGLTVLTVDLPGRPLVSASLIARRGAGDEPPSLGGAAVLAARALSEGTERYDAIALVEAAERLGASLHAEAGWDATSAGVDVPAGRLEAALELVEEMVARPTFPDQEVERLRDERLNDLLQAKADPRRRADEAFVETTYAQASPYHRPAGGTRETVTGLRSTDLRQVHSAAIDPGRLTLIIGGDLTGLDVPAIAERLFGGWGPSSTAQPPGEIAATSAVRERYVRVIHRPGSVQTEIRIGHVGVSRQIPDFHALSVMGAILGGLFNSRLNMKLREEKGYTYGAHAGFDLRRSAGPFAARAAVNTEATVPAIADTLAELSRIRETPVSDAELQAARDYLVGVFPLRFETPGAVVGALAGLVVHELPDDELTRYRPAIEAVTTEAVQRAAQERLDPIRAAIVLVGDFDAFGADLEAAGLGRIVIERDQGPVSTGRLEVSGEEPGPVDDGHEGPTEGAEEPDERVEDPTESHTGSEDNDAR